MQTIGVDLVGSTHPHRTPAFYAPSHGGDPSLLHLNHIVLVSETTDLRAGVRCGIN